MTESRRIVWLILVMMAAVSVSTAVAIAVLYRTGFERERAHLLKGVEDQAHLIEALARVEQVRHQGDSSASAAVTLAQIRDAFQASPGFDEIAEIVVGQRQGDRIEFLVTHGRVGGPPRAPIPISSKLAEPMARALAGDSGSMIGLDYRGEKVLAAYRAIPVLHAGVVAKIDLAAIRAPFLRAVAMIIGLALMLASAGSLLFLRLTSPMIKRLSDTERRYRGIFRGAPAPIWEQDFSMVDAALRALKEAGIRDLGAYLGGKPGSLQRLVRQLRIREANAAALQLFAAGSDREFAAWFDQVLVPATFEVSECALQALWDGKEALVNRTVGVKTLDGRDLTVLLSMLIPRVGEGYHSVPVTCLDVTADVKLRRREEELDLILASTGEGIFGMDGAGRCTFVNRAALEMLGYREQRAVLGREMHAVIHPNCHSATKGPSKDCPIYRACCENVVSRLDDVWIWRNDGSSFPAEYRSYPMLRDGTLVGTVVTFTDSTERKEREAQQVHAQKMEVMGQLTGGIAHDFNNLLTIILMNLRMLTGPLAGQANAETREVLDDALSAAEDGAEVVNRLLAFSRRQAMEPRCSEVNRLLADCRRLLRQVIGDDIDLLLEPSPEPLLVVVDPQQFENAILNLVINARDAMTKGGTIRIQARRRQVQDGESAAEGLLEPGSYAVVGVADTGVGMSAEVARRAVEPFFTTKPAGKGSGLGLSTVFGFAQQARGGLSIESAPGRGTRVFLYLPLAGPLECETRDQEASPRAAETNGKGAGILLVDDDIRTRNSTRRVLSELGYRVREAENAAGAMALLEQGAAVDLLFTDVSMPGELDGRALAHWARERLPGLKVLLTSGYLQPAADEEAPGCETLPFLQKPYSKEQLQQVLLGLFGSQSP